MREEACILIILTGGRIYTGRWRLPTISVCALNSGFRDFIADLPILHDLTSKSFIITIIITITIIIILYYHI